MRLCSRTEIALHEFYHNVAWPKSSGHCPYAGHFMNINDSGLPTSCIGLLVFRRPLVCSRDTVYPQCLYFLTCADAVTISGNIRQQFGLIIIIIIVVSHPLRTICCTGFHLLAETEWLSMKPPLWKWTKSIDQGMHSSVEERKFVSDNDTVIKQGALVKDDSCRTCMAVWTRDVAAAEGDCLSPRQQSVDGWMVAMDAVPPPGRRLSGPAERARIRQQGGFLQLAVDGPMASVPCAYADASFYVLCTRIVWVRKSANEAGNAQQQQQQQLLQPFLIAAHSLPRRLLPSMRRGGTTATDRRRKMLCMQNGEP